MGFLSWLRGAIEGGPAEDSRERLLREVQSLVREGRFRSALDLLLPILDSNPGDEFALRLATIVVDAARTKSTGYTAPREERLTSEYLNDPRLDPIFFQCERCGKVWVDVLWMGGYDHVTTVRVPLGGYCPHCDKVICLECAKKSFPFLHSGGTIGHYKCPYCRTKLEIATKPNGRKRRS